MKAQLVKISYKLKSKARKDHNENEGIMAQKEKDLYPKPVETLMHKDRRVNIPTEELRDFVADQEAKPKAALYLRDPSRRHRRGRLVFPLFNNQSPLRLAHNGQNSHQSHQPLRRRGAESL
jgi:hypothetical protein